jgi:hypothetical protein
MKAKESIMKKIVFLLALVVSGSTFAQDLRIRVSNWGNMVDLQIQNFTPRNMSCSGPVFLNTARGNETHFVNEFVWSRMTSFRTIYPFRFNDRIIHAHHSIRCTPTR